MASRSKCPSLSNSESRASGMRRILSLALLALGFGSSAVVVGRSQPSAPARVQAPADTSLTTPEERKHLKNVRQLTFGGQNAEAYFSADDTQLIFQHQGVGVPCDQIYSIAVDAVGRKSCRPEIAQHRQGPHHVQLFLSVRQSHSFFLHARCQRRMPAQARLLSRLRLAHLQHLSHLHRKARRQRIEAAHRRARL